jgi:cyclic pyranopterin phosphate synthase
VANPTIESAVYSFEGLLPDLESPPIAARRALDHAGLRLSVEAWRGLSFEDRARLTLAGVPERVDAGEVASLLRRANPPPQRVSPVSDPDPSAPPEALAKALEPNRAIDPKRWSRLRSVDRYALAHTYRRAVARSAFSILGEAFDAVLVASVPPAYPGQKAYTPQPPPVADGYAPAGYYSNIPEAREIRETREPFYDGAASGPKPRAPAEPSPRPHVEPPPLPQSAMPELPREGRGFATQPPPSHVLSNHLTSSGEVHMVDVARKAKTERRAIARGTVAMRADTMARLTGRDAPKGEVLTTARLAAIMAAKRTHELIPLCHAVALTHMEVLLELDTAASRVHVTAVADAYDRTGCEMEAMVAVSTACLTIYDMLKGIDRDMIIGDVKLMEKSGGRSGHYKRAEIKP